MNKQNRLSRVLLNMSWRMNYYSFLQYDRAARLFGPSSRGGLYFRGFLYFTLALDYWVHLILSPLRKSDRDRIAMQPDDLYIWMSAEYYDYEQRPTHSEDP